MQNKSSDFVVGGLQPLTMIDFPGRLATVIFSQGCNLRCRFCYNHSLLTDKGPEQIPWSSVISFLKDRQGFIEGVVFSGGEPCKQESFNAAVDEVKELGFETALHTNGFYPEQVKLALQNRALDYIAVDLKATFGKYQSVAGVSVNIDDFQQTVEAIVSSGVQHEYRTTVHPELMTEKEIIELADWLANAGVKKYVIQKFQHGNALDGSLAGVSSVWLKPATILKLRSKFEHFEIRGDDNLQQSLLQKKTA